MSVWGTQLFMFMYTRCKSCSCVQSRLGDMLGDLPDISSFTYTERASYKYNPQTPYQLFLRREPELHQRSAAERARAADSHMVQCKEQEHKALISVQKASDFTGVEEVSCNMIEC